MRICNLSSGSEGNLTYIEGSQTKLLIDDGLSCKETTRRLMILGVTPDKLSGILVTHEHNDHIKGINLLCKRYNIPVYVHEDGYSSLKSKLGDYVKLISFGNLDFNIGELNISSFAVPHDVKRCSAYTIEENGKKFSIATDLGHTNDEIIKNLSSSTLVYLESNHDIDMLHQNAKYPARLKARILGGRGHLSNIACAETIAQLVGSSARQIVLSHLSQENNSPSLAYKSVCEILETYGIIEGTHIKIDVATTHIGTIFRL